MFSIIGADGKEYGPVPAEKIRAWIAAGRANAQTQIRREGEDAWSTLGSLPEFAAPADAPPLAAAEPGATSSAPAADAPVLASREARLGASILDSLIAVACLAPGLLLIGAAGGFEDGADPTNPPLFIAGVLLTGAAFVVLVITQLYLLTTRGQTLGKRIAGVRIVSFETGQHAGFVKTVLLRTIVNGVFGAIPFVGGFYSIIDVLFIFREDRRCIHDLLAGTKVVRA